MHGNGIISKSDIDTALKKVLFGRVSIALLLMMPLPCINITADY